MIFATGHQILADQGIVTAQKASVETEEELPEINESNVETFSKEVGTGPPDTKEVKI